MFCFIPVTSMAGLIFMNRFLFVISDVHLSILFDNNSAAKNIIYKKRLLFKICIEFCVPQPVDILSII